MTAAYSVEEIKVESSEEVTGGWISGGDGNLNPTYSASRAHASSTQEIPSSHHSWFRPKVHDLAGAALFQAIRLWWGLGRGLAFPPCQVWTI